LFNFLLTLDQLLLQLLALLADFVLVVRRVKLPPQGAKEVDWYTTRQY